ncbi:hypothetical protein [Quisquiliibacterium transsilvanicum]|uniref:Uncharacterized protein n=1 Tax=Quisquiliibacterium transsilvanicum TaxID=1549638 RepID=A0A7W8HG87_9BURK|nr:hypothetical protein [Quisquiliibacterium transsilvanicum]MBB5271532.1 hypothetical protein [Quisquiliibacterium transsilvanicum]
MYCALCGRPMEQAAVLIGTMPVGPKCAQRAGLMPLAQRKSGLVFPVLRRKVVKPQQPQTLDMFPEAAA